MYILKRNLIELTRRLLDWCNRGLHAARMTVADFMESIDDDVCRSDAVSWAVGNNEHDPHDWNRAKVCRQQVAQNGGSCWCGKWRVVNGDVVKDAPFPAVEPDECSF